MPIRTGTCVECGRDFEHGPMGKLPVRCPRCSREHHLAVRRELSRRWRENNPERAKETERRSNAKRLADPEFRRRKRENEARRLYGIAPEELRALEEKQGHLCAICRGERSGPGSRLHVDHCHASLKVRGLLCSKCNTMLGLAGEDVAVLQAAIDYLS